MPGTKTRTKKESTEEEALPTTYYSESKKEEVLISEMENNHLVATLVKSAKLEDDLLLFKTLRAEVLKRMSL